MTSAEIILFYLSSFKVWTCEHIVLNSTCIFWSKLGVTMSILCKQSSFDRGSQSLHFLTKSVLEGISSQGKLAYLVHMLLHLRCHLPLPQLFFCPPQLPTGCFLGCFLAPHGCSEWPSSPPPWLQAPPWVSLLHSQLRPPPKLQIHDSDHLLDSSSWLSHRHFQQSICKTELPSSYARPPPRKLGVIPDQIWLAIARYLLSFQSSFLAYLSLSILVATPCDKA